MKTDEDQFTQWAAGTITYDFCDHPGVMRIFTQEAWTQYCKYMVIISGAYLGGGSGEPEQKEPSHDRQNELERCVYNLRRLVVEIATRPEGKSGDPDTSPSVARFLPYGSASGGSPDEKLCTSYVGFMNKFFDPKRMLKYESAREVVIDLRTLLTEGLYGAIHRIPLPVQREA